MLRALCGEGEFCLDFLKILFGHRDFATLIPGFVERIKMDVSVRNIAADDFPDGASAKNFLHVLSELFGGFHDSEIIFIV